MQSRTNPLRLAVVDGPPIKSPPDFVRGFSIRFCAQAERVSIDKAHDRLHGDCANSPAEGAVKQMSLHFSI